MNSALARGLLCDAIQHAAGQPVAAGAEECKDVSAGAIDAKRIFIHAGCGWEPGDIDLLSITMTVRLGSMLMVAMGLLFAALKLTWVRGESRPTAAAPPIRDVAERLQGFLVLMTTLVRS